MRPELGTVGWRGDGFQKSLGINVSRILGLIGHKGRARWRSQLTAYLGIAVIHVLLVLSLESDVRGSWAECGVQTSQKTEVVY